MIVVKWIAIAIVYLLMGLFVMCAKNPKIVKTTVKALKGTHPDDRESKRNIYNADIIFRAMIVAFWPMFVVWY